MVADTEVEVAGDAITVRARVPVGIGVDARPRFRDWEYRCRRDGATVRFVGFEAGPVR